MNRKWGLIRLKPRLSRSSSNGRHSSLSNLILRDHILCNSVANISQAINDCTLVYSWRRLLGDSFSCVKVQVAQWIRNSSPFSVAGLTLILFLHTLFARILRHRRRLKNKGIYEKQMHVVSVIKSNFSSIWQQAALTRAYNVPILRGQDSSIKLFNFFANCSSSDGGFIPPCYYSGVPNVFDHFSHNFGVRVIEYFWASHCSRKIAQNTWFIDAIP